jgi:hypothetical protein
MFMWYLLIVARISLGILIVAFLTVTVLQVTAVTQIEDKVISFIIMPLLFTACVDATVS